MEFEKNIRDRSLKYHHNYVALRGIVVSKVKVTKKNKDWRAEFVIMVRREERNKTDCYDSDHFPVIIVGDLAKSAMNCIKICQPILVLGSIQRRIHDNCQWVTEIVAENFKI